MDSKFKTDKMDSKLYKATREGNVEFLREIASNNDGDSLTVQSHLKNNVLHIAARLGKELFASEILRLGPPTLLCQQNKRGDTPLHVAARSGQFELVKLLIDSYLQRHSTTKSESAGDLETGITVGTVSTSEGDVQPLPLWRWRNCNNNTALHEALKNGHEDVALQLLERDNGLAIIDNDARESPLYLAAEVGFLKVLKKILTLESPFILHGPNGQNPLHVAASAGQIGSVEYLLEKIPDLIKEPDDYGKTALHHAAEADSPTLHNAAEANSLKMIRILLKKDPSPAYMFDNMGLTPLLIAASSNNNATMIQAILDSCPDSIELFDGINGQNALHIAVKNNYLRTVKKLLRRPEMKELINEPDNEGNTPMHLATKNNHYRMVKILMITKCVDLKAKNKDGHTALDICESTWEPSYRQKFIWTHLTRHKASGGGRFLERNDQQPGPLLFPHPKADLKQAANTVSVVATLLATVTFAAAFTMPGGYSSKDGNMGVAVLIRKAALKAFVLADTVAMCSSMMVAFLLIWATLGDPTFLSFAVNQSIAMLFISLCGTMVAFVTGLYVVIAPESLWLAILVCIICTSVPFLHFIRIGESLRVKRLTFRIHKLASELFSKS